MKRFSMKKKIVAGAAVVALGLGATAAYALWSATGSGSGSATATTAVSITVTAATAGPNADLYPGADPVAVAGTAANPNHYPVEFTGWDNLTVTGVTGGGTCATTDFTPTTSGSTTIDVPAQATVAPVSIPGAVAMNDTVTGTTCQGAVVTVTFDLTGGTQTT